MGLTGLRGGGWTRTAATASTDSPLTVEEGLRWTNKPPLPQICTYTHIQIRSYEHHVYLKSLCLCVYVVYTEAIILSVDTVHACRHFA